MRREEVCGPMAAEGEPAADGCGVQPDTDGEMCYLRPGCREERA